MLKMVSFIKLIINVLYSAYYIYDLGEWKSEETNNPNENRQTLQQLLTHLLRALERRDPQQLFAWPVTDRIAPNYSRLISKPMDFETIRRSIQSDLYTSLNAFVVSI